jgi:hypothetical protein
MLKERQNPMKKFLGWMMIPAIALSLSVVPAFSAPQGEKDDKDKKAAKKKGSKKKKDEDKDKK